MPSSVRFVVVMCGGCDDGCAGCGRAVEVGCGFAARDEERICESLGDMYR